MPSMPYAERRSRSRVVLAAAVGVAAVALAACPATSGAETRRSPPFAPDAEQATIRVLFPNTRDTLVVGREVSVRWTSSSDIVSVTLLLSITGPGGPFDSLDTDPFNTGRATLVFDPAQVSDDAYVKLVGRTLAADSAVDVGDEPFRIAPPANPVLTYYTGVVADDGVLLRWRYATRGALVSEWLERMEQPNGTWQALSPVMSMRGDTTAALDTTAIAGRTYSYRITSYQNDATLTYFTPYTIPVPGARLAAFSASSFDGAVEVRWRFDEPPPILARTLERSEPPYAEWRPPAGTLRDEGGGTVFRDTSVAAGRDYAYRLTVRVPGGVQSTAPAYVTASAPLAGATLSAPWPNPSAGAVRFDVELPADAEVKLLVLDVQGRRVARIHSGPMPRGRHALTWPGALDPDVLPGLYLLRLETPAGRVTRRIVVARLR